MLAQNFASIKFKTTDAKTGILHNVHIGAVISEGLGADEYGHSRTTQAAVHALVRDAARCCTVCPPPPLSPFSLSPLRRQQRVINPQHAVAVYCYTYELPAADEGDQIYSAMNGAMRDRDGAQVAFWRPMIWHVDAALQALPPTKGKLFRGINLRFDER